MESTATLHWGIKESLLRYIDGLEDGSMQVVDPASRDGSEFTFPLDVAASDFDTQTRVGTLQFRGSVILSGHWDSLRIEVNDPQLKITNINTDLLVRVTSIFTGERFLALAAVAITEFEPELIGVTRLTSAGRSLLGEQYQVGQELAALRVTWK